MKQTVFFLLALILGLNGCAPPASGSILPTPLPPEALGTMIAATSVAAATQTAVSIPTETPIPPSSTPVPPTRTLIPTPSPSATFIFVLPTPTASLTPFPTPQSYGGGGSSSGGSSAPLPTAVGIGFCQLLSASPSGEAAIRPGGDFDAKWELKNIAGRPWDNTSIDLVFLEGERMQKIDSDIFDMPEYVRPGQSTTLIVDMRAPFVAGTYTAIWGLQEGHQIRCKFSVTVKAAGTPYPTFTPTPTSTATSTATSTPTP